MYVALFGLSVQGIARSLFNFGLSEMESGVEEVVRDVLGKALAGTTSTGLQGQSWFSGVEGAMLPIQELVVAPLLFAATIGAVLRQDMRRLARAWLVNLPLSLIGGFAAVRLVGLGLGVTDALSTAIEYQVSPGLGSLFLKALVVGLAASLSSGLMGLFLCCAFLTGALCIWLELAVRSASIELAVFFMPLAFAGLVWPATAHWARRMVEILAAVLLAKPVIVGALCLGARALNAMSGASAAVEGATILLLAAFSPVAVLKLVPAVEASALANLHGLSHSVAGGAQRALRGGQRGVSVAASAAAVGAPTVAGAAGAAGGGAAGPGGPVGGVAHLLGALRNRSWGDGGEATDPLGPARFPPGPPSTGRAQGPANRPRPAAGSDGRG
jgi:hypothetical protein